MDKGLKLISITKIICSSLCLIYTLTGCGPMFGPSGRMGPGMMGPWGMGLVGRHICNFNRNTRNSRTDFHFTTA